MIVAIDGAIVPLERAVVPVSDRGFLYGDSVFETFRTYGGRAHALDRHLARLGRSAAAIELSLPVDVSTLAREVRAVVAAGEGERRVRLMVTRGDGAALADDGARRVILGMPFDGHPAAFYEEGVGVCTVVGAREHASAKAGSYLTSVLASREAKARGAYEALLIDGELLREGATSNVFVVVDGVLRTPRAGVLPGVTRGIVLELANELGLALLEGPVRRDELEQAEEAFLTSATREVMPIRAVDDRTLEAPGPRTRELSQAYRETLENRLDSGSQARWSRSDLTQAGLRATSTGSMSDTSKTKTRRANKNRKQGQKRKKQLAKKGTTPIFPIHPDGKKS